MEGFNQDTSLKKYELNDNSAFSPSTGSSGENELDILHLFGKEKLENIQQSLSKFTGLAFVTVDYRGRTHHGKHQLFRFLLHGQKRQPAEPAL